MSVSVSVLDGAGHLEEVWHRLCHVAHAVLQVVSGISDLYGHSDCDQPARHKCPAHVSGIDASEDEEQHEWRYEHAVVHEVRLLLDVGAIL